MAVYDATNGSKEIRDQIRETVRKNVPTAKLMMIESICDNDELVEENIRTVKAAAPDYKDKAPEEAVRDFKERIAFYKTTYESIGDSEKGSYIQVFNCQKFIVNNVRGYLPLKVTHFVMNLHTLSRTFYLTRHGQSEYNLLGKIGGDSCLSKSGVEYARRLADYCANVITTKTDIDENCKEVKVPRAARLWTSTLRRTQETAAFIPHPTLLHEDEGEKGDWVQMRMMPRRNLDELYAGTCDGMTYEEIEQKFLDEFERRQDDKLAYRYPRGESYMDVILRLEPLAHELERTREPILIIGHQGIHRIIYAYFMGLSRQDAPYVNIPLNTIIELTPHAYGCREKHVVLMSKKEMCADGQDEPITSMPVKKRVSGDLGDRKDDPVMNAPSC